MSFILDALKKAEAERNRRIAPVLMDARIAPPRRGLPAWAWALGAVLLVNLGVLGWLLWRAPVTDASSAEPATSAANPAGASPSVGQARGADARETVPGGGLPATATAPPAAGVPATSPPLPGLAPAPALMASRPAPSADSDDLPALDELRAAGIALPALQLNLHVYDPAPAYRSVLLNGIRLREGEYTPDGVKVDRITPTGVVLEASGRRFRLEVGG